MSDPDEPRGFELWLAPFLRDPALWPVTLVVAAIAVVFGATALLLALEGNAFAIGAALLVFWMSVDVAWRQRRSGASGWIAGGVAGFWLLCLAAAAAVHRAGWF